MKNPAAPAKAKRHLAAIAKSKSEKTKKRKLTTKEKHHRKLQNGVTTIDRVVGQSRCCDATVCKGGEYFYRSLTVGVSNIPAEIRQIAENDLVLIRPMPSVNVNVRSHFFSKMHVIVTTRCLKYKTLLEWGYVHWNCTTDGQKQRFCENPNHVLSKGERVTVEEWNQVLLDIELSGHLRLTAHEPDDDQREDRFKRRIKRQALKATSKKAKANTHPITDDPTPATHGPSDQTGPSPRTSSPDPAGHAQAGPGPTTGGPDPAGHTHTGPDPASHAQAGPTARGRGLTVRGRGLAVRGRGLTVHGRGLATPGRGLATRGHALATRGPGPGPATRAPTGRGSAAHAHANPAALGAEGAGPVAQTGDTDPATHADGSSPARPTIRDRMLNFTLGMVDSLNGMGKKL
jgi:hypothetical protein